MCSKYEKCTPDSGLGHVTILKFWDHLYIFKTVIDRNFEFGTYTEHTKC